MRIDDERVHTARGNHRRAAYTQLASIRLLRQGLVPERLRLGQLVDIIVIRTAQGQLACLACAPYEQLARYHLFAGGGRHTALRRIESSHGAAASKALGNITSSQRGNRGRRLVQQR